MKNKLLRSQRSEPRSLRFGIAFCLLACLGVFAPTKGAANPITKEYKIKASCLFNFAQFVDWPPSAFADARSPIAIGVLGEDEFGPFIDQLIRGETVKNRSLIIKRSHSLADLKGCQILFISRSEHQRVGQILANLEGSSILTVGETDGFAYSGGVVNFFLEGERIRFEINTEAARHAGLNISSQLLNLARIIRSSTGRDR